MTAKDYMECPHCTCGFILEGQPDPVHEDIAACIKHYEAEECRFDDPLACAKLALFYASRMPSSHVRALLWTLANAVVKQGSSQRGVSDG